ncbi:peptidase domain-containing ABC transporter [Azohydromonas caseinilytica]|uniref:Cyclolysin secretion/processing ATP-binding protein CyaB n=1 Tax=Azohydromonas caseinilytica TaxID=2728836 RepID=A0A848FB22_9BURK|nr:peptidase domain-containing ABC transporter [Azohydromonas caseinilytica]NML15639.1 peptidase domain-containing ABC transporter [Azohydromonas caseinilytica]
MRPGVAPDALGRLALGWGARLPMVLQTEAAECSLACLAMVAGHHGAPCEISELRRRLCVSLKGANLKDLIAMAERTGFSARPLRLELDEMRALQLPCILHWDLNHFVVLKAVARDGIVIHDPAVGVRRLGFDVVSRHFTGVALELTPLNGFQTTQSQPRVRMRSMLGRMVGLRGALAQLFALALAIEVFAVTSPLFMQWVVDHALVSADRELLLVLALGFGLLMLLRTAVSAMRGWIVIALGAQLKVQGRANLFTHLLNLPTAYFEARHLGDVMSRFGSQESMLQAITTDLVETLLDGLMAGLTLVIMFVFAPALAAVVLAGAALYALLRWAAYAPLRLASAEAIVWSARRDSHFLETLRGIKAIKLFNAQEGRRAQWLNLLVETVNRQLHTQKLRLLLRTANSLLIGTLVILVVWLGAQRVLDNSMTIGMLLAFIAYKDQFLGRVSNLIDRAADLAMLRLHAERLADIALVPPEAQAPARLADEAQAEAGERARPARVEVQGLRFRYGEHEPWVLDGVSFTVEAGETVAIVGASGCGKTTLLKILASLLSPVEGEVLVDGQPLARMALSDWRARIGVVMQDDQLFAGSIADNICFFADRPDLRRIEACARQACLHDEIAAMPMGYHTLIGDMGTVLSGGQKQRTLIARALYRNPGVLLLDEATSHLDVANEQAVSAAIRATQVTRIIVAHRPETIRSADRVIDLDQLQGRAPVGVPQRPVGLVDAARPQRAASA